MSAFAVYRIYDAAGTCMYVGCSNNPWGRVARHGKRADLPAPIASVEIENYTSHLEALAAELATIKALRPALNVTGLTDRDQRAPSGLRESAVLTMMTDLGRATTSAELSHLLGVDAKTMVYRLFHKGLLSRVGQTGGGRNVGRPAYIVVLADSAADYLERAKTAEADADQLNLDMQRAFAQYDIDLACCVGAA